MLIYTFDRTLDGLLTAVFDSFALHQQPDELLGIGAPLPLFCEEVHQVVTAEDKAKRVWTGLEKKLERDALRVIMVSYLSELSELDTPLFRYICKIFRTDNHQGGVGGGYNFTDEDVLFVRNICRRVMHEQLRMKQFLRFQKAKDGTYLGVVSPDHNVLPLVIDHFQDRFGDQPWLIYDARRHYGYYYEAPSCLPHSGRQEGEVHSIPPHSGRQEGTVRITFQDEAALPFDLSSGKLNDTVISHDDKVFQELWRTYFKAICIRERINPRKQLSDMPRRYWKYMTEKQ